MKSNRFTPNNDSSSVEITTFQMMGHRSTQEDGFFVKKLSDEGYLMALADGHICAKTMNLVIENIEVIYLEERRLAKKEKGHSPIYGLGAAKERLVLKRTFNRLIKLTENEGCGTTLTLCFLECATCRSNTGKYYKCYRAHVAVMGDSPFAVSTSPGKVALAPIHTAKEAEKDILKIKELAALEGRDASARYGYLYSSLRGDGLAVTRSLGDCRFVLLRKPEIKTYCGHQKEAILLIASDGILEGDSSIKKQLNNLFSFIRSGGSLTERFSAKERDDNTTFIMVKFIDSPGRINSTFV